MADNENVEVRREDDVKGRNIPNAHLARYKWMTSILTPARNRGMYLKPLEKITPDAKVPFTRIIIGLAIVAGAGLLALHLIFSDALRASYILIPVIAVMLGIMVIGVLFLLSSRGKSMFSAILDLNLFKIVERNRNKRNLHIGGVGIQTIGDDGKLTFSNGDLGVVYNVRGQLSNSTLPSVADYVDGSRAQYLISRNATSQEIRITSIAPNTMKTQIAALDKRIMFYSKQADARSAWRAEMAELQREYLTQLVRGGRQLTMNQTVILRDENADELSRTMRNFETMARGAMYERCIRVTDPKEIERRLAGPTLLSNIDEAV